MSCVLGIDVSSHAIDFVALDETTNRAEWTRVDLIGGTAFKRLQDVAHQMPTRGWLEEHGVYLIAVETPKTRFLKSAGALFPVYGAVVAAMPRDVEVWDVRPTAWRQELGLPGNAPKADCAARCMALGAPTDWPQDAFDAYAVAYYARNLNQRGLEAA
jgi:Holliday junction resolvasome RuvABC endonuclease subunit